MGRAGLALPWSLPCPELCVQSVAVGMGLEPVPVLRSLVQLFAVAAQNLGWIWLAAGRLQTTALGSGALVLALC